MDDLKLIKKHYSETMMHLCRRLFPTILETEGLLFSILQNNFAYSKFLGDDIKNRDMETSFKNYIYSLIDVETKQVKTNKTPHELLDDAGYILYECDSENDIQQFKKYYTSDEELCTFWGGRLRSCHVFFAVKKNVEEIKREDFNLPQRQDLYGTSVISIQFSKGRINTLSIKNRYNHSVNNPDATFSNNLDNIIPGLTKSFEKEYNLNINQNTNTYFELLDYVKTSDGKYYKYNYEYGNLYYGPNNVVIKNFKVQEKYLEKEKYLIIDYFALDLVNKKIEIIDDYIKDSFVVELTDIKKINITKNGPNKLIKITYQEDKVCTIEVDSNNRIISYKNEYIKKIDDYFFRYNTSLKILDLPNLEYIGNYFLNKNISMKEINLPNVKFIGDYFMQTSRSVNKLNLPNLEIVGKRFLENNKLRTINLPKVKQIGDYFLVNCETIDKMDLSNVVNIGDYFLHNIENDLKINLPNVERIGNGFCGQNELISDVYLPSLTKIGHNFLYSNNHLQKIDLPKVKSVGGCFLFSNLYLNEINMPLLERVGDYFLGENINLEELSLPNLVVAEKGFLYDNERLTDVYLPNLKIIEEYFLYSSIKNIRNINVSSLPEKTIESLGLNEIVAHKSK